MSLKSDRPELHRALVKTMTLLICVAIGTPRSAWCQEADESEKRAPTSERGYAVIIVGLPGDEQHRQTFDHQADIWRDWSIRRLRFPPENVSVLRNLGAEQIVQTLRDLSDRSEPSDALWVFFIGHGNHDQNNAWFHLPGPDLNAAEWGAQFANFSCDRQVFWMTQPASGKFFAPLSRPGRIVMTATDGQGEVNETRFPKHLAEWMAADLQRSEESAPVGLSDEADPDAANGSASLSVKQLFVEVAKSVRDSYEQENLLATEHPQLDDNGDGIGSELETLTNKDAAILADEFSGPTDGTLAEAYQIDAILPSAPSEADAATDVSSDTDESDSIETSTSKPSTP
ncbi:caspase family protein [Roseiconus nitratireducens]|uniref:caspase family protein n=1 Tax=Roseiconus nitratireducens TaxID=2605748 RepID=UPI001375911B|nr:caspase family protein [Roseiconus nitratireducens]